MVLSSLRLCARCPGSQAVCLSIAGAFQREQALDWLNTAIDDGRADLQSQRALDREIDAWDMSCRIMFMLQISS
jgi:hypothetical protein